MMMCGCAPRPLAWAEGWRPFGPGFQRQRRVGWVGGPHDLSRRGAESAEKNISWFSSAPLSESRAHCARFSHSYSVSSAFRGRRRERLGCGVSRAAPLRLGVGSLLHGYALGSAPARLGLRLLNWRPPRQQRRSLSPLPRFAPVEFRVDLHRPVKTGVKTWGDLIFCTSLYPPAPDCRIGVTLAA
jgi:hypothetical protein